MNEMEGTPKRQRAESLLGDESPETPSPLGDKHRSDADARVSFLPSPKQSSTTTRLGEAFSLSSPRKLVSATTSTGLSMPQSPMALQHARMPNLLPPETPKSKNQELFLSPSLELQSPQHRPLTTHQKPIREISNNLKTRLNYAYVKMQQNMVQHSKRGLDESVTGTIDPTQEVKPSSYSNVFAQDSDTETDNGLGHLASPKTKLPVQNADHNVKVKDEFDDLAVENSAQAAFLKALQSPKKKQRSLSSSQPKITKTSSSNSQPSEVEAIETLMSLSSPQKRRTSGSFDLRQAATTSPPPVSLRSNINGSKSQSVSTISVSTTTASTDSDKNGGASDTVDAPNTELGSPKLNKPVKLTLHSEVQTDIETDVESQSE